jgi:hypothetical protein
MPEGQDVLGWAGFWQPRQLDDEQLNIIRDIAGEAILSPSGEPYEWCSVSLKDGQLKYPIGAQARRQLAAGN